MLKTICLFCSLLGCFFSSNVAACSAFILANRDNFLLAKCFDWIAEDGLIIVNKRHIAKQAMLLEIMTENPLQWISRYGSITFVQAGRELPMGGMNETGLAIEQLWLDDTTYPIPDSRPAVFELQWIQYQLDTACSVEEVLASDTIVRIDNQSRSSLHFIVADRRGNSALIEFIDGEMVAHTQNAVSMPVLTNHRYEESLEFLQEHLSFGGDKAPLEGFESLNRFVRLSSLLQKFSCSSTAATPAAAVAILSHVANFEEAPKKEATFENMEELTRANWNIVYDIPNKEIHFLTGSYQKIRTIALNGFNFDGGTEVEVLDIQTKFEGDITHNFIPYTYELHRNLIDRYYDRIPFLREIPNEIREWVARYPETTYYEPITKTSASR